MSRELGVRYVLEGSVLKAGDKVCITAQLVEATTAYPLWSERYDRPLQEIFALQDELRQKIMTALKVPLTQEEQARFRCCPTHNLEAYDVLLHGLEYANPSTQAANAQAHQLFESAMALDPQYAAASALLGLTYLRDWINQWSQDPQTLERAFALAPQAIALDDARPAAHIVLGHAYAQKGPFMLGCGGWLMLGGPYHAAWQRLTPTEGRWHQHLPWLLSLTWMLSTGTFMTQIAHPVVYLWGGGRAPGTPAWMWQALGVVGMLWDTGFLLGLALLTMRRWVLPVGTLTLVIGLNAVAMGFLHRGAYPFLPVVARVVAALGAEVVYAWLQPSVQRPGAWRLFATVVPLLLTTLHFAVLGLTVGVWWSVHLWAGIIVLTGLVGLLISMLLVPPPWPGRSQDSRYTKL